MRRVPEEAQRGSGRAAGKKGIKQELLCTSFGFFFFFSFVFFLCFSLVFWCSEQDRASDNKIEPHKIYQYLVLYGGISAHFRLSQDLSQDEGQE